MWQLDRRLGQNAGNSGTPPSRDPAAERQSQAEERRRRQQASANKRRPGKQRGGKGAGPEMSATPDEIVGHRPPRCSGCDAELDEGTEHGFQAR